jgi:DNA-binding phage protein
VEAQPREIQNYLTAEGRSPESQDIRKAQEYWRDYERREHATSRSYHDYLISSLKDPERAAGNIEVVLELEEKDPQPDMLRLALKDVVEAREQANNLSEEAKRSYEKLDKILLETGGVEIYGLVELLDALGFRIAISFAGARSAIAPKD